jgi:hypothetical protein
MSRSALKGAGSGNGFEFTLFDHQPHSEDVGCHEGYTMLQQLRPRIMDHMGAANSHAQLYEAYQKLINLSHSFDAAFHPPSIVVIGHQSDGKSSAALAACFPACAL